MDDFLENAEPRVIAMMMIAIVILLCTIQVMYMLWPQIKQYREVNASYISLQQTVGSDIGLKQQLKVTTQEIEQLSYKLHGDMAGLPEKQMESYIIGRLQKVSWSTGVELASVIPAQGKQVQMFQEIAFNVQINATYFDFINCLQNINQELGYIVVKKFDIHPQTGKITADPELSISLTLVSYRMVRNA